MKYVPLVFLSLFRKHKKYMVPTLKEILESNSYNIGNNIPITDIFMSFVFIVFTNKHVFVRRIIRNEEQFIVLKDRESDVAG